MPTPERLVEDGMRHWGRLADRPAVVDPLEVYGGLARRLKRVRLKEWVGFMIVAIFFLIVTGLLVGCASLLPYTAFTEHTPYLLIISICYSGISINPSKTLIFSP